MANVTKGAKTTSGTSAKPKPQGKGAPDPEVVKDADPVEATEPDTTEPELDVDEAADRLRDALDADPDPEAGSVAYVGNTGHLYAEVPKPLLDAQRNVIGRDNGLFIDFGGFGVTRRYYPERNARDREFVERMDIWLDSGAPEIEKYGIRRLDPGGAQPPLAGWDNISAAALAEFVAANLGDDHDANVEYVKECARYERESKDRSDVLAMLDGLLVQEAAGSDVFEATVVLN